MNEEYPQYKCHKVVRAAKIRGISFPDNDNLTLHFTKPLPRKTISTSRAASAGVIVGGYWVMYEDGYESYSPALVFEKGYKRISGEKAAEVPQNGLTFRGLAQKYYRAYTSSIEAAEQWKMMEFQKLSEAEQAAWTEVAKYAHALLMSGSVAED